MTTLGLELSIEDSDYSKLLVATTPLEPKHIDELITIFQYFDTNQDGHLSIEQAILAFRAAAVVYETRHLRSLSKISKHDWLKLCGNYAQDEENASFPQDKYITMFKAMDVKRRGIIDIETLHVFFKTTGLGATLEQTRVLGESINKYGIGDTITEEEFIQFMLKREEINQTNGVVENEQGNHSDSTVDVTEAFGFY